MQRLCCGFFISLLTFLLLTPAFLPAQPPDSIVIKEKADSLASLSHQLFHTYGQIDSAIAVGEQACGNYRLIGAFHLMRMHLLGICAYLASKGEYAAAFARLEELRAQAQTAGDPDIECRVDRLLGGIYTRLNDFKAAEQHFLRAIANAERIDSTSTIASSLLGLGALYGYYLDYDRASACYQRSREAFLRAGDQSGAAWVLNNLGNLCVTRSDYVKAIEYFDEALDTFKKQKNQNGEAFILSNLGNAYTQLADYPKALEYHLQSLNIRAAFKELSIVGRTLGEIGMIYHRLKDYPAALDYVQRSLEIAEQINSPISQMVAWSHLGVIQQERGQNARALECLARSLKLAQQQGYQRGVCSNQMLLGKAYTEQQAFELAQDCLTKALRCAEKHQLDSELPEIYDAWGDYHQAKGNPAQATQFYAREIGLLEKVRGRLQVEQQKQSFAAGCCAAYAKMVLSLIQMGQEAEAYNYAERGRARAFLDLLADGTMRLGKPRHEDLLTKDWELRQQQQMLIERRETWPEDTLLFSFLRGKLETESDWFNTQVQSNRTREPELASLISVNAMTLEQIQGLLDAQSTLLEYFLTPQETLVWRVTSYDYELYRLPISSDSLNYQVHDLRSVINAYGEVRSRTRALYDLLIAPLAGKLGTEKLIIVPHGVLHYLPFQALQDESGAFLIDKYQISTLPSASVLEYLPLKRREPGQSVLALGDPRSNRAGYGALPGSSAEVQAISSIFPQSRVLTAATATETELFRLAPNYDVLHCACHADLNAAYPLFSALLLTPDQQSDGALEVHEIFTLDLDAWLVVLSGCETGLGHLTNGDDLVGLARAFIYAGTPSVIASLWMAQDQATAFLMKQFYAYLKHHHSKAQALRLAQIETRRRFPDLQSWAAFVLIGAAE